MSTETGLNADVRPGALPPIDTSPTLLAGDRYTDPARYQGEIEQVMLRSWLVAMPSGELAEPRSYVVWDALGQSVVITRRDDGTLSAWYNVCQHRGARLAEGAGVCSSGSFKCPWHGFGYDLDGRVTTVPLRGAFDEATLQGLRARAVAVEEMWGLVWVCLSDPEQPLREYLGGLVPQLDWYGLDNWQARYSQEWEIGANWKAVLDGFLETWHVPFTHKDTLASMVLWKLAKLKDLGRHSMMTIPVKGKDGTPVEPATGDERESHICHYLSFPNTIFSCFPTHVQLFQAWPVAVDQTVFKAWNIFGPTPPGMTDEEWEKRSDKSWLHFQDVATEDLDVLNRLGQSYGSRGFVRNMFNGDEGRLTAFHRSIDESVSAK
jgi:choline monooxygenase